MLWLSSNMFWWLPVVMVGLFLAFAAYFARDFLDVEGFDRKWLRSWAFRGLFAPLLIWIFLSAGSAPMLPPLTRHIGQLKYGGHEFAALVGQVSLAAHFIACWWTVLTLGWYLTNLYRRAKNTEDLLIVVVFSSPFLALFLWLLSGLGIMGAGYIGFFWLCAVLQYSLSLADFGNPVPAYSRAIGKIKFGKYREAEMAIIGELEKCQNDFNGWMMLAELYASQFHDLEEAERTIYDLCCEPQTTLPEVSIALHKLADWQLHYARNPGAARRALEDLCLRMPETHLATMARNRITQLPADRDELARQQEPHTVKMAGPVSYFSEAPAADASPADASSAQRTADELVAKLTMDPDDVTAREKLAHVFVEQLGQPGIALDQLDLLLNIPGQPDHKMAQWLGLKAACQVKIGGEASATETLERLVHEFPMTAQAFDAQRRLSILKAYSRKVVPITLRQPQHDDED